MAGFNFRQYRDRYIQNANQGGEPLNEAAQKYGVRIVEADVGDGETYWRAIGVHHLLPEENMSQHNVFMEAVDEQGNRLKNPLPQVGWTWEGRQPHENAPPVTLDKGDNEPAGNVIMWAGQILAVWMLGAKSDRVEGLRSTHPDEPLPDGRLLNTYGHHSFYVVFQRTRKVSAVTGLITGRLERGQGQTVRLIRAGDNQVINQQTVGPELTFRFENLPLGVYRVDVANMNIGQSNIQLNQNNRTVNIVLAVPLPTQSVIAGRVTNGQGQTLVLLQGGNPLTQVSLSAAGNYRFDNLGAGNYSLMVQGTSVRQDNIQLNGRNSQQINLTVSQTQPDPDPDPDPPPPPPPPPSGDKVIVHYLLLGPPGAKARNLGLLLLKDFILAFSLTVGFSIEEAQQANKVTIFGDGITRADVQALRSAGVQVEILGGNIFDIETKVKERIRSGQAFGG